MRGGACKVRLNGDCALVGTRTYRDVSPSGVSWRVARTKWDLAFAILLGICANVLPGVSVGLVGVNLAVHLRLSKAGG